MAKTDKTYEVTIPYGETREKFHVFADTMYDMGQGHLVFFLNDEKVGETRYWTCWTIIEEFEKEADEKLT